MQKSENELRGFFNFAKRIVAEPMDVYGNVCKAQAEKRVHCIVNHKLYPNKKFRELSQAINLKKDIPIDTLFRVKKNEYWYDWFYAPTNLGLRGFYLIDSESLTDNRDFHSSYHPVDNFTLRFRSYVESQPFPLAYLDKVLCAWPFASIEVLVKYCDNNLATYADTFGECRELAVYSWGNPELKSLPMYLPAPAQG